MMKDTCNKFIEGINSAIDNDTSRRITSLRFLSGPQHEKRI